MENSILPQVLKILNQAHTNQDGWSVELELYKLRDENPGKLAVTYCKNEAAHNALMIIVFDTYTRFFILNQDGTNVGFYTSPKRTANLSEELTKHVQSQGPSCEFCSHLIKKISYVYASGKIDPGTKTEILVEDATYWHCEYCGHDHMDDAQQNHLTNKVNQVFKSSSTES